MACVKPNCKDTEIILIDGTCKSCPLYTRMDPENRFDCIRPVCNKGSVITPEGSCKGCVWLLDQPITNEEELTNHMIDNKFNWHSDGVNKES